MILRFETLLAGFYAASTTETEGIGTLAVDNREAALRDLADGPPQRNDDPDIYRFFVENPDGRTVEIRTFRHDRPADPYAPTRTASGPMLADPTVRR